VNLLVESETKKTIRKERRFFDSTDAHQWESVEGRKEERKTSKGIIA